MKRLLLFSLGLVLIFGLAACSQSSPTAVSGSQDSYTSANIDTSYEAALPARNQLALGTLMLAGTPAAVTPEQAAELLPLWQALRSTSKTGESADAEVNAVLVQIESTLTPAQLAAIGDLQLTQTDLQEWAQASGLTLGSGDGSQRGAGQGMSPEARATRQAEEGRSPSSSGGGASNAVMDALIAYLETLS